MKQAEAVALGVNSNEPQVTSMTVEPEETVEFYKTLPVTPVGIPKDKVPQRANVNMSDAELAAFYSEQYVDIDVAEFLTKERRERLYGLCNLLRPGEFYLDVGCANAAHMQILYQRGINGIGLDLSVPNILRGRQKYPHLKFIHGFAEAIPFKDNHFDIVILGDVVEHFKDPKVSLAECLRVSRKGLALCIPKKTEVTAEHMNPFSCDEIVSLLEFYKLKVHFYDFDGRKIGRAEAESKLEVFPWLLIRVDRTEQTNAVVRRTTNVEGMKGHRRAMNEILSNDEWSHNTKHQRDETHLIRFKLLSHLIEGQKVLEVGCGNGDLSVGIAKLGFDVVGVDISKSGIQQAVDLTKKENLNAKAHFRVMDATSLDFADNSFDTVLITEVLEHIRDSRRLIKEAIRITRNGGRILISVPNGLLVPFQGHLRVFFKDTLTNELSQYTSGIDWHELPFKKWLVCSFFVKKKGPNIAEGPAVDILMPTYNGRKYIGRAIKSVLDQTYKNWTLVVVNDGGEDLKDILNEFHDHRIKYIVTDHNGKAHALNVGISNSNEEFIGYLDDDDILYPIHLELLIKAALEGKKDFVYSDWYEVSLDENGKEIGREFEFRQDVTPWMLIRQNYINHKCILHRRSLLRKAGMYDEELDVIIDWDMIRRLAFISKPCHVWGVTSERLRYYNKTGIENRITGMWTRNPDKARGSMERIINKTMNLSATTKELKRAVVDAMLHQSYIHSIELNNAFQAKDIQISNLESAITERDTRISHLQNVVNEKDVHLSNLESIVLGKEVDIQRLKNLWTEKEKEIVNLNEAVKGLEANTKKRDLYISDLETAVKHKDAHLQSIKTAFGEAEGVISNLQRERETQNTHIVNLQSVIRAKDQFISGISSTIGLVKQKDLQLKEKDHYIRRLESNLEHIHNSHGWKFLLLYYRFRDRLLPVASGRRDTVRKIFKAIVSSSKYLKRKPIGLVDPKLIYHIETDMTKPLVIGKGNALYLHGWCYHTQKKIKRLTILVDGIPYLVSKFSLLREDVFQAHFGTLDVKGNSLHSGFWVILPFHKIDCKRQVRLDVRAEISGGDRCESLIGWLTLELGEPLAGRGTCTDPVLEHTPLVAICMAAYNPPLEYFRREIDSILHQNYTNWICIINDDCSRPEIFGQMQAILGVDRRFKIFRNMSNEGFYHNFERCLSYVPAQASFIALSDQDDIWHEDKLSRLLSQFDDKTLLVYSDMNIVNEKEEKIHSTYWTTRRNNYTGLDLLILANTVTGAASMFRKELLELLLPFPEKIGDAYHDNFIACVALSLGKIKYVDFPLYDYRQHSQNIFGHKIHGKRSLIHFFREFKLRNFMITFKQTLLNYRGVYYHDYIRRVLLAHVLQLRCSCLSNKNKRVISRFVGLQVGISGIAFEVLKIKMFRRSRVTVGNDVQLLKSGLSIHLLNFLGKMGRYPKK